MCVSIFVWTYTAISRSKVAWSYSTYIFNFLSNWQVVSKGVYACTCPREKSEHSSCSVPLPSLVSSVCLILEILIRQQWYVIVILICISLCSAYFHELICHLNIFFGEISIKIFCSFCFRLFIFLLLSLETSLYILNMILPNMILPVSGCLFSFLNGFQRAEFLNIWNLIYQTSFSYGL